MKKYLCDACGNEFDPNVSMLEGWYEHTRKIKWMNPDGTDDIFKVRKTISVFKDTGDDSEIVIKIDVCPNCIKNFERP